MSITYFIHCVQVRSLGYIVVGINEYYTSKKCPDCQNFVGQVNIRQFYCTHCARYHHRDVMAAENMAKIVQEYLEKRTRPLYLQPVTQDGRYPWMSSSTVESGAKAQATSTITGAQAASISKRRLSATSNRGPPGSSATTTITSTSASNRTPVTGTSTNGPAPRPRKRTSSAASNQGRGLSKMAKEV